MPVVGASWLWSRNVPCRTSRPPGHRWPITRTGRPSMGNDGALLACRDGIYLCDALDVTVKGTVGTGDSMVAGICKALVEESEPDKILIYACAAAHASVIHEGTTPCTKADFEKFIPELTVIKL